MSVLDIGHSVIHNHLSLGMLIEVPKACVFAPILKDLLFAAHTLKLEIEFSPISTRDYHKWVGEQGKPPYLLSLPGRKITSEYL